MLRRWTPAEDALLATLTPAEMSRRTGRSLNSIQKRRWKLKHRGEEFPDYRYTPQRRKAGRSVWTPKADELVRQHRPYIVAKLTGIPMPTVLRRRKSLGLPPIGYGQRVEDLRRGEVGSGGNRKSQFVTGGAWVRVGATDGASI